jgi:flagellin-specific chaperone FliS
LLSTDFERNLCEKYLFKYDEIIQDLIKSLDDTNSKQLASKLLNFPCGILRGALANLG